MAEAAPKFQYQAAGFSLGARANSAPVTSSANALQLLSSIPLGKSLLTSLLSNSGVSLSSLAPKVQPQATPNQGAGIEAGLKAALPQGKKTPQTVQSPQTRADDSPSPSRKASKQQRAEAAGAAASQAVAEDTADTKAPETASDSPRTASGVDFIPLPKAASATTAAAAKPVAAAPGSADALADQRDINSLGQRPYWMPWVGRIDSPLLRLHQELVELCELLQPTPEEAAARASAVAAVAEVVNSLWPSARVEVFGSFATGLYVPTSDIDLVVMGSGLRDVKSGLQALANALSRRSMVRGLQVIAKAKVPIVKFETVEYGNLAFDISFDVANGPQAAELVKEMTARWPMMRPLILVLKLFLQQRELNEVYTGGIGSYALLTMVTAFLQLHASRREHPPCGGAAGRGAAGAAASPDASGPMECSLGVLLVDFLRFYSRVLHLPEVGVSCSGGGTFFRKRDKPDATGLGTFSGWCSTERPYLLAVEDPKDPGNDVCRNSYNIMRVKMAFEYAYVMVTTPCRREESLLGRVLRLGPILASRPRPRVADLRAHGYYCEPPRRPDVAWQPAPKQLAQQQPAAQQQAARRTRPDSADSAQRQEQQQQGSKRRKRERDVVLDSDMEIEEASPPAQRGAQQQQGGRQRGAGEDDDVANRRQQRREQHRQRERERDADDGGAAAGGHAAGGKRARGEEAHDGDGGQPKGRYAENDGGAEHGRHAKRARRDAELQQQLQQAEQARQASRGHGGGVGGAGAGGGHRHGHGSHSRHRSGSRGPPQNGSSGHRSGGRSSHHHTTTHGQHGVQHHSGGGGSGSHYHHHPQQHQQQGRRPPALNSVGGGGGGGGGYIHNRSHIFFD